ncbi:bis(5'-nucleosyl)-tetraphosphatase (symmetrical) YqeK [Aquibacillus salsiterrae]|uniref:bis(5'-nucleosyl)-tetraphosphatase (symmetrical) n=1 Tax=Aquibacillus salsiterrae TaxID=2950439 RepID=A0A9X3WBF8_9BACI|nr:bis(5'-nucleosyl)-tetraphosphatase (symmetrical) YqeK [Aquibacillus salsiterrae]MDC3415588.1 bis(5'-nucleosyl)-tetraphosphatase (symmetrical) YqeK [Aquibacillus salsiterrae]
MDKEKALAIVKPFLTDARYEHTKRVVDTAVELAAFYEEDTAKAETAAIFHDYAKYRDLMEMEALIKNEQSLPSELLVHHSELWHAPVGALLVEREVGIGDPEILSAIRWHTTGKADMSRLDKIIFLADYIEPGRDFPGIEKVRPQAKVNLDLACFLSSKNTINFLLSKNQPIYPDTIFAYNDLFLKVKENLHGGKDLNG